MVSIRFTVEWSPIATGVKMANPKLTVCCFGGDGGLYGEGLSHLISAARHNIPVTVFVADNQLYSLTTGQASPTTPQGAKTKSTPFGTPGIPLDMVKLVKSINQDAFARRVESKNFKNLIARSFQLSATPASLFWKSAKTVWLSANN